MQIKFPNGFSYSPGVKQHLVVTVSDSSQRRWGFQLAARQGTNSSAQAGTFSPGSDGYTQLACTDANFRTENFGNSCSSSSSMPLQYIEHTQAGTRNGQKSSATFEFDWTPPASDVGTIKLYVAGNAANGDGSDSGDHIYTQNYTLTAATPPANLPTVTAVVNGASFQPAIASASWITIQGTNLSNTTRSWRADEIVNGALPTSLDGVSVTVDGKPAYVSYISPTQINAQAPTSDSAGQVSVQVTNNGQTSTAATAQLQPVAPAFFLWAGKYPVATHADYSYVGPPGLFSGITTTPAKAGDVIILWGTGFGVTNPSVSAGQIVPSAKLASVVEPPSVTVGGVRAPVVGAALSPGAAALYQIAIQIPDGVPSGDQPVVAQINGVQSPGGVVLNMQ